MQQESKLAQVKEKIQVKWGVELFSRFVLYAAKRGIISSSQAHTLEEELKEFAQAAIGEDPPESIAGQLNQYIGRINAHFKQNIPPAKYSPFPTFSFATGGHLQSAVLDQLDMVERTLTEAAESGIIDWDKESGYFAEVLQIFSQVESRKMRPEEGMARLAGVIERINQKIDPDSALPLPDLSAYE
ncbi:MAG: hypothetical protein JJU12_06020 [Chlamydiales bacterium]|nr:hypothetical protein [Chlamydiales bacterium]